MCVDNNSYLWKKQSRGQVWCSFWQNLDVKDVEGRKMEDLMDLDFWLPTLR